MEHSKARKRKNRNNLGVAILLLVMGGALFVGLGGLNSSQNSEKQLADASSEAMDLLQLKEGLTRQREQMLLLMLTENPTQRKALEAGIRKRTRQIDAILDTFTETARDDPTLTQQLQELKAVRASSQKTRDQEVIPLIQAGRTSEARRLLTGIQQQRFDRMRELTKSIAVNAQNKSYVAAAEIGEKSNHAFVTFVFTFFIALTAGIGLVLLLSRAPNPH